MAALVAALVGATACALGAPTAPTVIVLAVQGLGPQAARTDDPAYFATRDAVRDFMAMNPGVRVDITPTSPTTDVALRQVSARFGADSPEPDVVSADVVWIATLARNHWLLPLDRFHPRLSDFFDPQLGAARVGGTLYALPWFIDAEGIFYRTDLVASRPTTPQQLVEDARTALHSPGIKYGVAFEGSQYEGLVTAFMGVLGGFGGTLDLHHLDTPENVRALAYLHDLIYVNGVAPNQVRDWKEADVRDVYAAGEAVFAIDWPYVYQKVDQVASAARNHTAWIPFPSGTGPPRAALGGWDLVINARSKQPDLAYRLIQYLLRPDVQIARAVNAGAPPAVRSAYNSSLYRRAPWFRSEPEVFQAATPRPVDPLYPDASAILQAQLERVLKDQVGPQEALAVAQQQVGQLLATRS